MKKNKKEEIKVIKEFNLPKYNEIPDVGLYLDQVVKYINSFFESYEDIVVTPSMLTNYVKHKIVSKVSKKTYSRDQIAHFIFIALVKNVLSLNNISLIFQETDDNYNEFYDRFVDTLLQYLDNIENNKALNNDKSIASNIACALAYKLYLDKFFNEK